MKCHISPITALLTGLALAAGTLALTAQDKPSAAPAAAASAAKEAVASSVLGAWELKSFKYGDVADFKKFGAGHRRIKLITAGHFVWVNHDTKTNTTDPEAQSVAGGTYTLDGDQYVESVEYGDRQMAPYFGKTTLTLKIEGDQMQLSGSLANGLKIAEVWQRVK